VLDVNRTGSIDHQKITAGVEISNRTLPEERLLNNPDELFKILDAEGKQISHQVQAY